MREWKAQHGLSRDSDSRLPSDLLGIVNGLWDALRNKADIQIDSYRQESDIKLIQLQQELTQLKQREASLKQDLHSLEEQLHQRTNESQHLKAKLTTEEQEKIRMTERAAALESRRQEHKDENQRLHQLLKHVQENLEHYQAATQRLREEQSLLVEKQRIEYEQRLTSLQTQTTTLSNEKSAYQAQNDHLKKTHDLLVDEHKMLATRHAETQSQHESLKTAYDSIQHGSNELKKQNQAQAIELTALQNTLVELRLHMQSKDEKIASLEDNAAKANDKIETLRHECQFTLQEKANLEGQLKQMQAILSSDKVRVAG